MRQYQNRGRENPYFHHTQKIPWKGISAGVASLIAVLVLTVFLFSHSALTIQDVVIDGLEYIERSTFETEVTDYLDQRALLFFRRSNQFLFSMEDLQNKLEQDFTFTSLSISQSGKVLSITVQERTSNLVWATDTDKEYIVDLDGIIVRPFKREVDEDAQLALRLPVFYDTNEVPVVIGDPVLTPEEIISVFRFHEILGAQGIGFTSTRVNRLTGGWMSIVTKTGYEIYFDVTGDIEAQGESLKTVLASQVEDPDDLEYIDLRFGEYVYFK